MRKNHLIYFIILISVFVVGYGIFKLATSSNIGSVGSAHRHAAFKVYINGEPIDFSQPKYQLKSDYVHLEGGDGDIIHTHATGIMMGFFLKTIGIGMNENCIRTENKNFCNENERTLKFFVNGKKLNNLQDYEIKNLDKILITYGNESDKEIIQQTSSVANPQIIR